MKFVYKGEKNINSHWDKCKKRKAPFIEISMINNDYANIFYDITDTRVDLEALSNDIKKIYSSYVDFLMTPTPVIDKLYDQYYFFNLIVERKHAEFVANKLFDYLVAKISS